MNSKADYRRINNHYKLIPYIKSIKFPLIILPGYIDLTHYRMWRSLMAPFQHLLNSRFISLEDRLHLPVTPIFYPAFESKAGGLLLRGVPEEYPLHTAINYNMRSYHGHNLPKIKWLIRRTWKVLLPKMGKSP
jgi:hypothetical protein